MKKILAIVLICISSNLFAQKSSIGLGVSILNLEHRDGLYFNGNVRTQFTKTIGWQTEIGYGRINERIFMSDVGSSIVSPPGQISSMNSVQIQEGIKSIVLKSALTTKLVGEEGFRAEVIMGGGIYKESGDKTYGMLSGELYLSVPIGNNLIVGIPISYNYIPSRRDRLATAGLSLRYRL